MLKTSSSRSQTAGGEATAATMPRSDRGKLPTPPTALDNSSRAGSGTATRLLQDLEAISKALSIKSKTTTTPKSLLPPPTARPRSLSAGKQPPQQKPKKSASTSTSSSIFSWKALKSLSHIRHRRFDCRFTLQVHSIENLPSSFNDSSVFVHWKRIGGSGGGGGGRRGDGGRTRAARVFQGAAELEEVLSHRCSVYGSRQNNLAKYESRQFVIWVSVVGAPELDLGKHRIDLTRLLPLNLEELDEEDGGGEWSTAFRLVGRGRGGVLNVSFRCSVVREKMVGKGKEEEDMKGELRRVEGRLDRNSGPSESRAHSSMEDKVLHEVMPNMPAKKMPGVDRSFHKVTKNVALGDSSKLKFEDAMPREDLIYKGSVMQEVLIEPEGFVVPELLTSEEKEFGDTEEPVRRNEEDSDESDFTVIEQGIEMLMKMQNMDKHVGTEAADVELNVSGKERLESTEVVDHNIPSAKKKLTSGIPPNNELLVNDPSVDELKSTFRNISLVDPVDLDIPAFEEKTPEPLGHSQFKSNYMMGRISKSLDLDEVMESVASEFLNTLGIEHSPFGLASESQPESPRERLLKEFEQDSLLNEVIDSPGKWIRGQIESDLNGDACKVLESNLSDMDELDWGDDIDLNEIVHAAEIEHQKATQAMKSKTRAKLLEDAEAETLMREWGLNEKAFHTSPPGSRSGFGSPIHLPPEDPLDLPPLGHGLGPFLQTRDRGFVRSMNPLLFKNAKNSGSLVMQVSSPVVMPAEMGSGVMDILQQLASMGIEKLSMQARKIMPLEDITGKTMQQVAWEALPVLEANESHDSVNNLKSQMESGHDGISFGRRKKSKNVKSSSSRSREANSEYVSLEDLAPLAMDKIEALSIEGLRIQSGMSEDDAPSNIYPQSVGDVSAFEGRMAMNSNSHGLEGVAGLQLLDVKDIADDVDGLMSLSLTLDEWMWLDSGIVDEDDLNSERTSKILAAHHVNSADLISGGWKGGKRGGKNSGRRCGLLGNNFTVALMVQLRDPMRNYEPVGTPMLSLIQVERVFIPPKPKIYSTVSNEGNSEQYYEDIENKPNPKVKEETKEEEEFTPQPQFKVTEVHIAGLKTEPGKKKPWGDKKQQQSGSRWLLANGMGKSNKHPFLKSRPVNKPSQSSTKVQPGDTLWSISSHIHGGGGDWRDFSALNPHIRNPDVIIYSQ